MFNWTSEDRKVPLAACRLLGKGQRGQGALEWNVVRGGQMNENRKHGSEWCWAVNRAEHVKLCFSLDVCSLLSTNSFKK